MPPLDFSHEEVERATRYHRPRYFALLGETVLSVAALAVLQWAWLWPWHAVDNLGWAGSAAAYAAIVTVLLGTVGFPIAYWRGYVQERAWGFSTQSLGGWLADLAKGEAIGLVLTAGFWVGLVALGQAFPSWWPAAAAAAVALLVFLLSFVAPFVLEPVFNHFEPLADERLAGELRAVAERAGVPIRDVLVADASRRTTKLNAYVSGLGKTRRVVIYDTLLAAADEGQLKLVVAHELAHRRERHVAKLTAGLMAAAAAWIILLWVMLGDRAVSSRDLPLVLLVSTALRFAVMPFGAWVSRRYERVADRFSLQLTDDLASFERAHVVLARKNLGDLQPPRLVYWLLFSHPTAPERLALGRAWAAA